MSSSRSGVGTWSLTETKLPCAWPENIICSKFSMAAAGELPPAGLPLSRCHPAPSTDPQRALLYVGASPASLVSNDGGPQFTSKPQSSSEAVEEHRTWEWPFVFITSHFITKFVLHKVNSKLFYCRWRWILILAVCSSIKFIASDISTWSSSLWSSSLCWPWRDAGSEDLFVTFTMDWAQVQEDCVSCLHGRSLPLIQRIPSQEYASDPCGL